MTFSMSFLISEVVLLPIPFTDLTSRKVRPAIVVGQSSFMGDLFVIPISSQLQNVDVALLDWRAAGLNVPCGIKPQLATIEEALVIRTIGVLSSRDCDACKNLSIIQFAE
jgi:mRNA interferase MazF